MLVMAAFAYTVQYVVVQRLCCLLRVKRQGGVQIPDVGRDHEHPAYCRGELQVRGGGHSLAAQQLRQRDYDALQTWVQQLRLLLVLLQLRPQQMTSTEAERLFRPWG